MRSRWISSLLVCATVLVAVPSLQAVESKDAVPESASVILRWKSPQGSLNRLAEFVDAAQPGFGNIVKGALPKIGQAIGNPGMIGVDLDQDIWAVAFFESKARPTIAYVVTAKNVDAVKRGLEPSFYSYASGNVFVYSDDSDALRKIRNVLDGKGKTIWSKIDAASIKHFETTDLSMIVNIQQLTKSFAEELKQAEPQIDAAIERIEDAAPDDQKEQMAMMFDVYRQLGKSVLGVVRDSSSWTLGFAFSKEAVRYSDRWQVQSESATAKFLAGQSASDLSLVNHLPDGKVAYFGGQFTSANLMEWSMALTRKMLTGATPEQLSQFDASAKEMSKLKFGEMAMYFDVAEELPILRSGAVMMVSPSERMREIAKALSGSMDGIKLPNMTQTQKWESDFAKIGADSVDRITIKQEINPDADPTGMSAKINSFLFGEEGMQQLVMYRRDRSIQSLGSIDDLKQLVAAVDSTSDGDSAVATARKRFPAKSNAIMLIDMAQVALHGLEIASDQDLLPFDTSALDDLEFEPSYLGYTLVCEPTSTQSQLEIPVELVKNLVKIGTSLKPKQSVGLLNDDSSPGAWGRFQDVLHSHFAEPASDVSSNRWNDVHWSQKNESHRQLVR